MGLPSPTQPIFRKGRSHQPSLPSSPGYGSQGSAQSVQEMEFPSQAQPTGIEGPRYQRSESSSPGYDSQGSVQSEQEMEFPSQSRPIYSRRGSLQRSLSGSQGQGSHGSAQLEQEKEFLRQAQLIYSRESNHQRSESSSRGQGSHGSAQLEQEIEYLRQAQPYHSRESSLQRSESGSQGQSSQGQGSYVSARSGQRTRLPSQSQLTHSRGSSLQRSESSSQGQGHPLNPVSTERLPEPAIMSESSSSSPITENEEEYYSTWDRNRQEYIKDLIKKIRQWPDVPKNEAALEKFLGYKEKVDMRKMPLPNVINARWRRYEVLVARGAIREKSERAIISGSPELRKFDLINCWLKLDMHVGKSRNPWPPEYEPQFKDLKTKSKAEDAASILTSDSIYRIEPTSSRSSSRRRQEELLNVERNH
ncbi:MAG: hypothetical protein Q9220_007513 [cf. Caloplaca sp. 1 TL-2023]